MKTKTVPERVGEHIVRGVAASVSTLLAISLAVFAVSGKSGVPGYTALFLCLDFSLRALGLSQMSPLALLSRTLQGKVFFFTKRAITAKPKKFAAAIGAFMSAAAVIFWFSNLFVLQGAVLYLLLLFSFLEAAFRFCAGCKIFALLVKLGIAREDICEECVLPGGESI